jgi:nucleotide-binding universal stress UspA family protein
MLHNRTPEDRRWLRERVLVDGGKVALDRGREWADALGVELAVCHRGPGMPVQDGRNVQVPRTFRPARVAAQLVVVDAAAGHVRWRVRRAVSPLLVARGAPGSGRILAAVDFGDPADHVLAWVARLAHRRQARVTLIHSIEPGIDAAEWMANFGGSNADFVPDDIDARRSAAAGRLFELLAHHALAGDVQVGEGPPARFVLDVARTVKPELVVIGAPRHHGFLHVLHRTVADEVAASSAASVLVVPHRPHLRVPE